MQLFGVRMPAWRPGARPGIDPARDVKPVFPAAARAAGVSDSVTIQFVVDEHGALIQRTMRLVSAGHIEYAQSVMEAAIGSQYIPAMASNTMNEYITWPRRHFYRSPAQPANSPSPAAIPVTLSMFACR